MIFLTFDFIALAVPYFALFALVPSRKFRFVLLIGGGMGFQTLYGGWQSLLPALALAIVSYLAGISGRKWAISLAIVACVGTLLFYKYTVFLLTSVFAWLLPMIALGEPSGTLAPAIIPLGISFFTFEFVHYLVDVYRGQPPMRSPRDFASFTFFWPSMVAGPIKRYESFLPSLHDAVAKRSGRSQDLTDGLSRIAVGCVKKILADNLTAWIDAFEPHYDGAAVHLRWLFLVALALRILFDFSGYSDMAIGLARIMGITVPENFNWPYIARSPSDFWRRWHMSLSSWIRDYVYIPLGGNRHGVPRRVANAMIAMVLCGLWHGAAWNFAAWGLYHGVGLAVGGWLHGRKIAQWGDQRIMGAVKLLATQLFVWIGWLLFFYPIERAVGMSVLLFRP